MVEKDTLIKTKIKHNGIFDFKETYRILFEWLIDKGYDLNEKGYKEVLQAGGAKEIEVDWDAVKKVSDYFKNQITIKFHPMGMTSVEVEVDGVKQKMNKGAMDIEIACTLLKDYEERWSNGPFVKFLRALYDKYLIRERVEQYEGKLIAEMNEFVAQAKAFLAMTGTA
ncbi:MAG: hypothetical protein Q8L27_01035 [archaeon]|nr:hypothetical protein [archaeon]